MIRLVSTLLVFSISSLGIQAAEDEVVLLSVGGDLIDLVQSTDHRLETPKQATDFIQVYHQLLADRTKEEVDSLHEQILGFIPGFEVAYTAADSAEIAHIMSEIDLRLAAIQAIHRDKYTQDVAEKLTEAYQLILPTFGDEP
ncbi:MAG: hypothetical protein DHS20C12_01000 [Pseudohongiella sp.]|nr:MAG: hypothetical protein DHS20C12_01000 [Pseudohongiella sp.]